MKRIHCKEEHNKTNTSYDNSRGGNNKSNWKKNKTKTNNNFTTQEGQKQIKLEKV